MTLTPEKRAEDLALVERVRAGDVSAYQTLVETYETRVYRLVYGIIRDREEARDITQDAFIKAYNKLDSFRGDASFSTWMYRIARNKAIDAWRRRKTRAASEYLEDVASRDEKGEIADVHLTFDPAKVADRKELLGAIMDGIDTLGADHKEILVLREIEGLSYREIAEIIGIPEGTVMSRLFYARKRLQAFLIERGFSPNES